MKITNKCELCGKRYKFPSYIKEGDIREQICFTCEIQKNMVEVIEKTLVSQYGDRYVEFIPKLLKWRDEGITSGTKKSIKENRGK